MKKIIIIRGNSGSGKTTVSKLLQKEIGENTLLLSQDIIRIYMLNAKDGINSSAIKLLINLVEYGYKNNEIVILEGILNSKWYKPLFDKIIDLYKENIFSFYYDIPFAETIKRHSTRKESLEFGVDKLEKWYNERDFLPQIEEIKIKANLSIDETVNFILNYIDSL